MFADDLSFFYSTSSLGKAATYTHGGTSASIVVIFFRDGLRMNVDGVEVQSAGPQARCKTSDVSAAARGDTLVISGTTYYVTVPEPINELETMLHLSLTA